MDTKHISNLRHAAALTISLLAALALAGCGGGMGGSMGGLAGLMGARSGGGSMTAPQMPDMNTIQAKSQLMQDLMNQPDLPQWHEQRQKMMLALGDRTFDKNFEEVFDGMIIALASLGCRVNNMERTSGYITASLPDLGPDRTQALSQEMLAEYVQIKGYPASVLKKQGAFDMDPTMGSHMMSRFGSGLTLTIGRQNPTQTKVKLRFDSVYFPKSEQELYKFVWVAVDKQMFLDKALDAPKTPVTARQ